MPFTGYLTELPMIVCSALYVAVRSMLLGHNFMSHSKSAKTVTVTAVVVLSLAVSVINGVKNYALYGRHYTGVLDGHFIAVLVVTFFSSAVCLSAVFALLYGLNKAGQQRFEKS